MTDERTKTEDVARVDEAPQCCQSCGRNLIATLAWECNDGLRRCADCQRKREGQPAPIPSR